MVLGWVLYSVQFSAVQPGLWLSLREKKWQQGIIFSFHFPFEKMYGISSMFFTMQTQMPPHPPNLENGFLFPIPWSSYLGRTAVLWSKEHCQVQRGVSVVSESENQSRGNLRPHSIGRLSNLWMSHLNPNVPLNSLSTLNAAWNLGQLIKGYLHRPGNNHWKLQTIRSAYRTCCLWILLQPWCLESLQTQGLSFSYRWLLASVYTCCRNPAPV